MCHISLVPFLILKEMDLIGKKVRGFRFDGKVDNAGWSMGMESYVGKIGTITEHRGANLYMVDFIDDYWLYPATLIEDYLVEESTYPKVMEVSQDGDVWFKRVVFMEKNSMFLAWAYAETVEQSESCLEVTAYEFARDVSELVKVSIQEIANWRGCKPEQIEIV